MIDRLFMLTPRPRRGTVGGYIQTEIAHLCVVCGVDDAAVRRQSREDQARGSQIVQQGLQRSLKEGRMHRLEHEIVLIVGPERLNEGPARASRGKAGSDQAFGIRPPLAKIIVHVNGGNARAPAPLL